MTVVMPDTQEIVKDGALTPAGIHLLTSLIDGQNGLAEAGLTDEQIALLASLEQSTITASGAIDALTSSYFDTDGGQYANWVVLRTALIAGTATNAQIQEALWRVHVRHPV